MDQNVEEATNGVLKEMLILVERSTSTPETADSVETPWCGEMYLATSAMAREWSQSSDSGAEEPINIVTSLGTPWMMETAEECQRHAQISQIKLFKLV